MTSGTFHQVPLTSIIVHRDNRQRRDIDPDGIDILADSIRRLGLIHPLTITRECELVAGERRYWALTKLGWISVPVQFTDELDPAQLRAIELEENIKRQDISWQDQVRAVREYHALRSNEAGWSQAKTADAIGLSRPHVNSMLQVANELASGNKLIGEAPRLSTAEGIVRRAQERRDQAVLDKLHEEISQPEIAKVLTTDFALWAPEAQRFNFIHCDFPYGIGADTFMQGGSAAHGGYTDTPENWNRLMKALAETTRSATTSTAHLMFWFAMRKNWDRLYEPTCATLEAMGWTINPQPLIWIKSDGVGIIPDPERGPRQIYETCLLGTKGDRKIVRAIANAYSSPTVRDRHMSEKPEPMLRHFFGMLVDQHTVMLDPTCGSGSALRAAESLGARNVLGLEINPTFAEAARETLERSRRLKHAAEIINATPV